MFIFHLIFITEGGGQTNNPSSKIKHFRVTPPLCSAPKILQTISDRKRTIFRKYNISQKFFDFLMLLKTGGTKFKRIHTMVSHCTVNFFQIALKNQHALIQ